MGVGWSSRHRLLLGTALLAFWLGWVGIALMPARTAWQGDPNAGEALLRTVVDRLPVDPARGPLAVRLRTGVADDKAWQAVAAGITELGGHAVELDIAHQAGFEVLILAPGGRAVYAGPLMPGTEMCGDPRMAVTRLRQWLPHLLMRTGAPLLIATT